MISAAIFRLDSASPARLPGTVGGRAEAVVVRDVGRRAAVGGGRGCCSQISPVSNEDDLT